MSSSAKQWSIIAVVFLAAVVPYAYTVNGDFIWDDDALILHNAFIQDIHQLPKALTSHFWNISSSETPGNPIYAQIYRPVVTFAYSLEYYFFDGKAPGFRVVSLLLHLFTTLLAYRWLRRRFESHASLAPVVLGALIFAFHPTRPEVVVWISGCTDLWMAFFGLLGLEFWDRHARKTLDVVLACLCFSLALLAKEVAVVIPALLIADNFLLKNARTKESWRDCIIASAAMVVTLVFRFAMVPLQPSSQSSSLGAIAGRVLASYGYYAEITLWPWEPSSQRAIRYISCAGEWVPPTHALLAGAAFFLVMGVFALYSWRKPQARPWLSDFLWFFLPLLPVSNLMNLGSDTLVAERFLYFPFLGFVSLVARSFYLLERAPKVARASVWGVTGLTLLGYFIISTAHAGHFKWNRSLWEYQAKVDPWNPSSAAGYAGNLYVQHRFDEALNVLLDGQRRAQSRCDMGNAITLALSATSQALGRTPDTDQETLFAIKNAYDGVTQGKGFRLKTRSYEISLDLKPKEARFVESLARDYQIPRAIASGRTFYLAEAEEQLKKIVSENARSAMGWKMLILISARQGKWQQAEKAVEEALARMPGSEGIVKVADSMRAAKAQSEMVITDPTKLLLRNADVQVKLGSPEGARRLLAPALEKDPANPDLVVGYVSAMHEDNRDDLALQAIARAREANPNAADWDELAKRLMDSNSPH